MSLGSKLAIQPHAEEEWTMLLPPRHVPRVRLLSRPLQIEHDGAEVFPVGDFVPYEGDDCGGF